MDLAGSITAPALHRRQDEIGLLAEHVGAAGLDRVEGPLRRLDDYATRAGPGHDDDRLDHAEVSVDVFTQNSTHLRTISHPRATFCVGADFLATLQVDGRKREWKRNL